MNVLLLGEKSNLIYDKIISLEHNAYIICDKITIDIAEQYDFIISFGYRHIIKEDIIDKFINKIINLHISYLPYNKGADPNLWSYLENTPKGVTIHYIDKGYPVPEMFCYAACGICHGLWKDHIAGMLLPCPETVVSLAG